MRNMANNGNELKEKLKVKLREIFQFESEDLDFGIYRIMNYKRKEIKEFIEKELIGEIRKQLELVGEEEIKKIKEEFEKVKQKIKETLGESAFDNGELKEEFKNTPLGREYYEKKKQVEEIKISEDLEREIYNHLINFFSRYYDKGDFISKRRYGKNEKYVVPYNGEEVLLYWANKDQYYIKTTEYFRRYTFWNNKKNLKINFKVVEAEEEKGNIKAKNSKFFILSDKVFDFIKKDNNEGELNIYFEYRAVSKEEAKQNNWGDKNGEKVKQENINATTIDILHQKIPKNSLARLIFEKDGEKTLIEKHLYKYTRRNTTDYFIHKDLKGFLERELDFYIKNEFLNLDDLKVLEESGYFDKLRLYLIGVRAFRNIALKIIEFLAQIENFQKKLWEKKKFVIDTHYVITLDKIKEYAREEFLESILDEILSNEKQLEEWKELFGIEVKRKEDLIENSGELQLNGKEWKKLPIDTKYFDEEFKWKLLVALSQNLSPEEGIDDILDGILIKSENWQALNLLLGRYREKVKTIYIDPPFNSKSTEILYKNNYKHSSWLCLMENRLSLSKQFLNDKGVYVIAIDENEQERLGLLIDLIFGGYQKTMISIVHNPSGIQGENFSYTNEFAYFIYPRKGRIIYPEERSEETADVRQFMNTAKGDTTNYLRETGPNCFYPILVKNGEIVGFGNSLPLNEHPPSSNVTREDGIVEVYPIDDEGVERKWVFSRQSVEKIKNELFVKYDEKKRKYIIMRSKKLINYKTVWTDSKYSAKRYGTLLIKQMGLGDFDFPKSVWTIYEIIKAAARYELDSIILDFFAGSGTTAHAVMKLNKEDGGKRKFILGEMADYFDTVIIPRIKKVAYSFNWKEGKPQNTDGIGVFFKYHTLEQYEDVLENIEFDDVMGKKASELFPDYIFYMLEWETKNSKTFLNIDEMRDPFNYKLKIVENYQPRVVNVDLVETFNYLLGLNVSKYKVLRENGRKYVFVLGEKEGKRIAIVWRNIKDIDFEKDRKIIEENLKDFEPDEVYINGEALVKGFRHIEPMFKSLMFEGVRV